ncbi:hypothetical protein N658DRAFT_477523 [Parathielavia hyrcaniae]|uniref:Uncharacterized protein n=1 Tax=Parathielavia hyrcaniae TaxID=113614 RepID=A0AAN6PUZ4_9PEZI|nr:hypothetical protein N658DRAFT_477523 [Parathielavia hyrcaniae]
MAPGRAGQNRKRGRPPATSKAAETASGQPVNSAQPAETSAPPGRRGRLRKSADSVAEHDESPAANQADQIGPVNKGPKKRGRPPKTLGLGHDEKSRSEERPSKRRRENEALEAGDGQAEGEGKRRMRNSDNDSANELHQVANPTEPSTAHIASRATRRSRQSDDSTVRRSPRERGTLDGQPEKAKGRPGQKPTASDEQQAEEEQTVEELSTRRSRRERRSADDNPWWTAQVSPPAGTSKKAPGPPKPKRGRPSLAELSVSKSQNKASPSQNDAGGKQPRGRPHRASNEGESSKKDDTRAPPSKPPTPSKQRPNRRPATEAEPSPPSELPPVSDRLPDNHRHLTTLTRHIPRATIASKWMPLDTPSITAVTNLLTEASIPILHRLRERDARHTQAQSILRTFAARLRAKLVKGMPFPPATVVPSSSGHGRRGRGKGKGKSASHEVELDFEKTVDAVAGLEKALDPLLHSVVLLKAEKEREERALEREYEVLRRLEGNARAQVRGWREGMARGREHVLLGGMGSSHQHGDGGGREVVAAAASSFGEGVAGGVFKNIRGEELLALSQQIENHMESMGSNLGQIEGVLPAIAKTRAALQGTLCEYLDSEQYEQVLLG